MVTRWAGRRRLAAAVTRVALGGVALTGVAFGGVAFGGVVLASPARADVTVTPDRAVQGEAAKLTFRVTDEREGAYTTKIEVLFPESAPIAEVWPLTVPDWAPAVSLRKLDRPLNGLHHGQVTEVTSQITWVRAAAAKPSDAAELLVSMGPMPQTDRMLFTVVQTYSDGTVVRWSEPPAADGSPVENQAVAVTLTESTAGPAGDGGVHGGAHGGDPGTADRRAAESDEDGGGFGSLATGLLIGLIVGGGVAIWLARGRRGRPAVDDDAAIRESGVHGAEEREPGARGVDASGEPVPARRAWRLYE